MKRLHILAWFLSGLSLAILIFEHIYLRHTLGFYFPFNRTGVFATLWLGGVLAFFACVLGMFLAIRTDRRHLAAIVTTFSTTLLSLAAVLFVLLYMAPSCRWAFPEHLQMTDWNDPVVDFQEAIRHRDLRKVILTNHLGFEQPGWTNHLRNFPKVILTEEDLELLQNDEAWALHAKSTNYAAAYNKMLQAYLQNKQADAGR